MGCGISPENKPINLIVNSPIISEQTNLSQTDYYEPNICNYTDESRKEDDQELLVEDSQAEN